MGFYLIEQKIMPKILLDRLLLNANIDMQKPFYWGGITVSVQEVQAQLRKGATVTYMPYAATSYTSVQSDKQRHIAKIINFIEHPGKINNIKIDNVGSGPYNLYPVVTVADGWHRLMAAYILGFKTIKVDYQGREDLLRYLQGKRKTMPID